MYTGICYAIKFNKGVVVMFCPNCGKDCENGSKFCLNCGAKLEDASAQTRPETMNSFDQSSNGFNAYNGYDPSPAGAVRSSGGGAKKIIIISLIGVLVIALGLGAFFLIKNKIAHDSIVNNPTKYVYSSYSNYLDEVGAEDEFYQAVKGAEKTGTVKLTADAQIAMLGSQNLSAAFQFAYDQDNKKYYVLTDASGLAPLLMGSNASGNNKFELFTDSKRLDFDIDVMGKQAKYYIDFGKLREQAENSIFSPDKDNVLGVTKEQFNDFIDAFEKSYHSFVESKGTSDAAFDYEGFLKKLEECCVVSVESGSVNVGDESKSVDIVTYTIDYESMKKLIAEMKDEIVDMMQKSGMEDMNQNIDEMKKSYDDMLDEFSKNADKDLKIEIKCSVEKSSGKLVKIEGTFDNCDEEDKHITFNVEFITKPDMCIKMELSNGEKTVNGRIYRETTGSVTTYGAEMTGDTDDGSKKTYSATIVYDKSAKTFTVSVDDFSFSGTAEVKDGTLILGYEQDLSKLSSSIGQGTVKLTLEISSKAKMNEISAENNLFSMSKEDFESLSESSSSPVYDYDDYDYSDDFSPFDAA